MAPSRPPPAPQSGVGAGDSSIPPPRKSGDKRKHDPMIGRLIAGRFKIESVIARGGMGKVYRGEQQPLGRPCAVKILNPKYDGEDDPEFQRRFFLEASTASKLTHANTVTIFDYGLDEDVYYIAMEYVAGRTLFRLLRDDGPLEEARVAFIISEVGRSLREAHGIGVIHRDMKPANIVLTESESEGDQIRVLDFGLVKHVEPDQAEDLTQQGLFMGSPKYMAPEQILGHAVSPATDIYALGVVAYELLTGKVPFDRGSSVKTLMAHCNDAPKSVAQLRHDLSPIMTSVVMRCLEKDPKHRYQSIDELHRDLSRVTGGGPMIESLLRVKKASLPPVAHGPGAPRELVHPDPDEDTVPTGVSQRPSIAPVDEANVGQWPSATPEPMSQAMLSEFPPSQMSGSGRGRMGFALGALTVAAVAGVLTLGRGDGPPASGEQARGEAPAAPVPMVRVVRLTSSPPGAKVMEGDDVLCGATPCEVSWRGAEAEQTHRLVFSLVGHSDGEAVLDVGRDALDGKLEPVARVPSRKVAPSPKPGPTKSQPTPKGGKTLSGYKDSPY
jgi:eukaryotic-like serine/threonine-protein kinase